MIKKHQRWIALLVTIAFAWMAQVSAMPLAAAGETDQPGANAVEQSSPSELEQSPEFIEQLGPNWNRPAKLKVTTVLIIVGVLLALSVILVIFRGIGHGAAPREGASASAANRFLIYPNRTGTRI